MIWLGIYLAGVLIALVGHGAFGDWQDDSLGVFHAFVWPIVLVIGALHLPIYLGRWLVEQYLASVDTRRMAETENTGSVRSTGGAVPEGQTPNLQENLTSSCPTDLGEGGG